jgi:hypothetical protein
VALPVKLLRNPQPGTDLIQLALRRRSSSLALLLECVQDKSLRQLRFAREISELRVEEGSPL